MNKINYTEEQLAFINSDAHRIVLESIAGSGKSTSIIGKVNANPNVSTLIVTFSKKLEMDLNRRLNNFSTKICTIHSLAYNAMMIGFGNVSSGSTFDIKKAINCSSQEANHLHSIFNTFCSSDKNIKDFNSFIIKHISKISSFFGFSKVPDEKEIEKYLKLNQELFESSNFMSHSKYLKQYQLSSFTLSDYDIIYVDEYQDLDDCMMDIFLSKTSSQKIYFTGDKNQKIFNWKGTTNFIPKDFIEMNLSQSMRCPQEILNTSAKFLERKSQDPELHSSIKKYKIEHYLEYKEVIGHIDNNEMDYTLIGCTNTESIEFLIEYIISNKNNLYNLHLECELNVQKFSNYYKFNKGEKTGTWIDSKKFSELIEYFNLIKSDTDIFLLIAAKKLANSKVSLEQFIKAIHTSKADNNKKTLRFSNVFLSKGREFHNVIVLNDFYKTASPFIENTYCNYLYTTITRSQHSLFLPKMYLKEPNKKVLDVEFPGSSYLDKIVRTSELYTKEYNKILKKIKDDSATSESLSYLQEDALHHFVYGMSEKEYKTIERIDRELPSEKNMRELGRIIAKYQDYMIG